MDIGEENVASMDENTSRTAWLMPNIPAVTTPPQIVQNPHDENTSTSSIVGGVHAAAPVYMNQLQMVNPEPVLQLGPPFPHDHEVANMEDDNDGQRSGSSNSISATIGIGTGGLTMQAVAATQGNYYNLKRCSLCNTFETPMWRRGPLGPMFFCLLCMICRHCAMLAVSSSERRRRERGQG
ncbi:hypothetical protein LINPERHAP1_LOCUS11399 [Linum perenne]